MRFGLLRVGAVVTVFAGALAGPASAATTLGEVFEPTENYGGDGMFIQVAAPDGKYVAPTGGVITSWSFQAGATEAPPLKLKMMRSAGSGQYTVVAESSLETPVLSTVNTWGTRIPVEAGDFLGVHYSDTTLGFRSLETGSGFATEELAADPGPGSTDTYGDTNDDTQIDLAATLETDADGDGFGDETQDACPTSAAIQSACPLIVVPDTIKPVTSALGFSASVFRAAKKGPAISAKPKVGTTVSFTLSEAASVKFTVQRKTKGRKVSGKCVKPKRSNRAKKKCVRWVEVKGYFKVAGVAGRNTFRFRGRIGGRTLKPGRYRLNSQATDAAGNEAAVKRKKFEIVR